MAGRGEQLPFDEQPQGGGHLIVAAPAGVQAGSHGSGDLGDAALDGGVDVFVGRGEGEGGLGQLLAHPIEGGQENAGLLMGEHAAPLEAADVSPAAGDVVGGQPVVERQAGRERQQRLGRALAAEAALPEGHESSSPAWRSAHVWIPRPHSRTKPSASSWRKRSASS